MNGPTTLSRRALLALAGATACGGAPTLTAPSPASPRFALGVACGEPTPTGITLWTHYTAGAKTVVRLWRDGETFHAPWKEVDVTPDDQGLVHVRVEGLTPHTWYQYGFVEQAVGRDTAESELGRFRTPAPDDELHPLRFGAVSCDRQDYPLDTLADAARRGDLEAFLFLGDTLYADGANDLPGYRAKWQEALGRAPNRALRAATACLATWDDHEVLNNYGGDSVPPQLLQDGRASFFEYMPVRRLPEAPERIWRSHRLGAVAEFFVLDCRSERNRAQQEYLSPAQLAWFLSAVTQSTAVFKIILNSVPISEFPGVFFQQFKDDRWEGYPEQRRQVLSTLDDAGTRGVLWLSGDFHLGSMGRISRTGPGSRAIEALVGPGGQFSNPSPSYPGPPQFDFSTARNNYVVVDLEPADLTARLRYIDGTGRVFADRTYTL